MSKANVPTQFSAAGNGQFREVGVRNLWEKEDLYKTYPPREITLGEPETLGSTLTSTGWFEKSLLLRGVAYSPRPKKGRRLTQESPRGRPRSRIPKPLHDGSTLRQDLLGSS